MCHLRVAAILLFSLAFAAQAQTTTFTYQGRLNDNGLPATGNYDFEFRLFNAQSGGTQVGAVVTRNDVAVTDGVFTMSLDFGSTFDGSDRFLGVSIRPGLETGNFTLLTPRQAVTAVPYSLFARNLHAVGLVGTIGDNQLPANVVRFDGSGTFTGVNAFNNQANQFTGNGSGLTGLKLTGFSATEPNRIQSTETPGTELLDLVAAKDLQLRVGNDYLFSANRNSSVTIGGQSATSVSASSSLHVGQNQTTIVDGEMSVGVGSLQFQANGNATTTIGNNSTTSIGGSAAVQAGQNLSLQAGNSLVVSANNIALNPQAGVTISTANPNGVALAVAGLATSTTARVNGAGNWDVNSTEGDFRVGDDNYRFKIGVAKGGGGTGDVWMRAQGGTARVFIKTPGGTIFYSDEAQTAGVSLATGGGSWISLSDRNAKENFAAVRAGEVLEKVAALPLSTWNYKSQDRGIRHIGPMAQDFKAAFNLGETDTGINSIDADGVALAAIQGLNQKVEEKERRLAELEQKQTEIDVLKRQNAELMRRLERLEQRVQ